MATSEAFQKAANDSKKLTSKPDNQDLLDLYGTSCLGISSLSLLYTYVAAYKVERELR